MQKKEIAEIKKVLKKTDNCAVSRIAVCYVSGDHEIISKSKSSFLTMADEEQFKYCDLFTKGLSGTPDKNQVNLAFPLQSKTDLGKDFLYRLLKSRLDDDSLLDQLYEKAVATYSNEGNYAILVAYGDYDVPGRTSDGLELDDGSVEVDSFLQILFCPVTQSKAGLAFSAKEDRFIDSPQEWMIQKPENGILYPSFNDRVTDLNECLYYQKKPAEPHEEIMEEILGCEPPTEPDYQATLFTSTVEQALGDACTLEDIMQVQENVAAFQAEKEENGETAELTQTDMKGLFQNTDAANDTVEEAVTTAYENDPQIQASNVTTNKTIVQTNGITITAAREYARLIETKMVDGVPCVVIPASIGEMTVNGVKVNKI